MERRFYVLMLHGDPAGPGGVLTTEPVTRREADRQVSWQLSDANDGRTRATYPVCTYDPGTQEFVEEGGAGRRLKVHRHPYTEEGFASFLATLPEAP